MRMKISIIITCAFILFAAMTCEDPESPEYLECIGIEVANVNNEGENPIVSKQPTKKEAYMIAVRYLYDTSILTCYAIPADTIKSEKIFTNTDFDELHPKGSDVTHFFEKTQHYYPPNYHYSYILRKIPDAGTYSFKMELSNTKGKIYEASTDSIKLY